MASLQELVKRYDNGLQNGFLARLSVQIQLLPSNRLIEMGE
jgi:hypothetical protein